MSFGSGFLENPCDTDNGGCPSDEICEMLDSSSIECTKNYTGDLLFRSYKTN